MVSLAHLFAFGPEIYPVDFSMSKPQRSMMRMVVGFVLTILDHRILARHFLAVRTEQGPDDRLGTIVDCVFRNQLVRFQDTDSTIMFFQTKTGLTPEP